VYWEGNTANYHTEYTDNKELLEGLLGVSKAKQLNPGDLRKLLVATWHNAAARGNRFIGKDTALGWGSAAKLTRLK